MQDIQALLNRLTVDVTALAKEGKLASVIARDREIEQIIAALCNNPPQNPLLIGERGIGKTAIIEGLAQRIANNQVPNIIEQKRILQFDITHFFGGHLAPLRYAERLHRIIHELKETSPLLYFEGYTVLPLEELAHEVQGSSILKPVLEAHEITCLATIDHDEYTKLNADFPELGACFNAIYVDELSPEKSLETIKIHRLAYEKHHNVTITDEAIEACVKLADQYRPGQALPGRALDLMDEAAYLLRRSRPTAADTNQGNLRLYLTEQHIVDLIASWQTQ